MSRINDARCFSVLADETTDIPTKQQMTIFERYVDGKDGTLREDFLQFEPVTKATGVALSEVILNGLKKYGINTEYLRGQGYDVASSAMSGIFEGVQAHVQEACPLAYYVHCASHVFNSAVCDACDVPAVRNCLGTAKAIYAFFNTTKKNKYTTVFATNAVFTKMFPESISKRLQQVCATRWVQKHEAVITLEEIIVPVSCLLYTSDAADE